MTPQFKGMIAINRVEVPWMTHNVETQLHTNQAYMALKHLASNAHNDISITRINCLLNWDVEHKVLFQHDLELRMCVKSGVNQTFSSPP